LFVFHLIRFTVPFIFTWEWLREDFVYLCFSNVGWKNSKKVNAVVTQDGHCKFDIDFNPRQNQ